MSMHLKTVEIGPAKGLADDGINHGEIAKLIWDLVMEYAEEEDVTISICVEKQ